MESMVKIDIVYWKDKMGGEIRKVSTEAFPHGFEMNPKGEWEMLLAAEDKDIRANELIDIAVKKIEIPEKAVIVPCYFVRHALGTVATTGGVGMPKPVEEKRTIDTVIFHPIFDGEIHKGELLAVINIFYATRFLSTNASYM
ncbi:MAG: DUF22 domain-containing protein [Candidatus Methanolliviera hydrocarbonicum]|uniref:DUF22 domain-containing protein n=1 Tax=Candidatus Methanolliviera hydrocarbonicum TaxID=2491085 RepID=A0A520KX42_9EURY|nr:MAG: DUF22 domain-containing protein [Candidatus Methanolliviera hydrocarbonicum]